MNEAEIQRLRSHLHGNDVKLRRSAIRTAVAHAAETTVLIPDIYRLCGSESRPVASDAWAAIRRYKSFAVPFLLQLMNSHDPSDRQNAIHLLLGLGHNRSSWRIHGQILDDRPDSRPQWGPQRENVVARLNDALNGRDNDVRAVAAITLDEIGFAPPDIVAYLSDGLNSDDTYIQNLSALHLGRLGPSASNALPALETFVESNTDPADGTHRPVLAASNAISRINGS